MRFIVVVIYIGILSFTSASLASPLVYTEPPDLFGEIVAPTNLGMLDSGKNSVTGPIDPIPLQLLQVAPSDYPAGANYTVFFNEAVEVSSANFAPNYTLNGEPAHAAQRDSVDFSVVHVQWTTAPVAAATPYVAVVENVKDWAGNTILPDFVANAYCFGLKDLVFRGNMSRLLANTAEVPPYSFSVEGNKAPLTFNRCDTGLMVDTLTDDIWEWTTTMAYPGDCWVGTASEDFEWQFNFQCSIWESLPVNRVHTLDLANGATDTLEFWWSDEDPTMFTNHAIDVEYFVDMSLSAYAPGDTVGLNGYVPPLAINQPSDVTLVDDGTGNDAVAGDLIFSTLVTFPAGARKDVAYKFLLNTEYECSGENDRRLFLDDELFDTVGGALGPLTLPVVKYDFCNTIPGAVEVVFTVDFNNTAWEDLLPGDVVSVNGTENGAAPTFDWSLPSRTNMVDDGTGFDTVAGDKIFTTSVVFPDSSTPLIEYKYLLNGSYECTDQGRRNFSLDPDNFDAVGNPQILALDRFELCDVSAVPGPVTDLLVLNQNHPNPFNPSTQISFNVSRAGEGFLAVYNVRGEMVRTLQSGHFEVGPGVVVWDGRNDADRNVGSGVYFYRLNVGQDNLTRRMVLLK